MKKKPILILIAGGTSSAKSTLAKKIEEHFRKNGVVNLCAENYIKRGDIHLTLDSSFGDQLDHHFKFNDPTRLKKVRLMKNLKGFINWEKQKIRVRKKDSNGISK